MPPVLRALLAFVIALFRSCRALQLEILALRHQVAVYKQSVHRRRLRPTNRLFWVWLTTWKVLALTEVNGEDPQKRVYKEVNPREDQDDAADRRGARHDPSRAGPISGMCSAVQRALRMSRGM